jgi:hypothetical protein
MNIYQLCLLQATVMTTVMAGNMYMQKYISLPVILVKLALSFWPINLLTEGCRHAFRLRIFGFLLGSSSQAENGGNILF